MLLRAKHRVTVGTIGRKFFKMSFVLFGGIERIIQFLWRHHLLVTHHQLGIVVRTDEWATYR